MQAQGGDGGEPVFHGIPVNDVGSAAMSAFAIVAALFARTRTGVGQDIQTSLASQSVLLQIGELTLVPRSARAGDRRARLHRRQRVRALLRVRRRMDRRRVRHAPRAAALFEALGLRNPRCREDARRTARRRAGVADRRRAAASVGRRCAHASRRGRRAGRVPSHGRRRPTRTHSSRRTTTTTRMSTRPSAPRRASPASPGSAARRRNFNARRRPSANTASMCCASSVCRPGAHRFLAPNRRGVPGLTGDRRG